MYDNKNDWKGSREGFGDALVHLGKANPKVVVLTGDLTGSVRADAFKKKFPNRFFQFGVAEQNMMCAAAGMSLVGLVPFVCTYGIFSSGRCWEQLRLSVCYSNCNVKIEGTHAGLLVGPDGASHQATEDIAITRVIPNLTVIVPCDSIEAKKATLAAAAIKGPVYLRLGREPIPVITTKKTPFRIGKANIMTTGKDVVIIACGAEVHQALLAAKELQFQGIQATVVNIHTTKPIDKKVIIAQAKKTGAVVTVEEHQVIGGLGSAVAEVLAKNYPVPIEMIGIQDEFGTSGHPMELIKKYNLYYTDIVKGVLKVLKRRNKNV